MRGGDSCSPASNASWSSQKASSAGTISTLLCVTCAPLAVRRDHDGYTLAHHALSRRTSSEGYHVAGGTGASSSTAAAAPAAMRLTGWVAVVSAGPAHAAAGTSSNPATATSSGTSTPSPRSATIAPKATVSQIA